MTSLKLIFRIYGYGVVIMIFVLVVKYLFETPGAEIAPVGVAVEIGKAFVWPYYLAVWIKDFWEGRI